MATERQIAANRANARHSTGPKTLAGKMASSRNAFRHGLSGSPMLDEGTSSKVAAIAHVLAGEEATEDRLTSAADFTRAQLTLLQIRATRTQLTLNLGPNPSNAQELRRIAALDRYERYCLTRRRRASNKLQCANLETERRETE